MKRTYDDAPKLLKDYLVYLQIVKNRSELTVLNYLQICAYSSGFTKSRQAEPLMIQKNFRISQLLISPNQI